MTRPGYWPLRGNVTSLLFRGVTDPVIKGALVTLAPLTKLMEVFVSKTKPNKGPTSRI